MGDGSGGGAGAGGGGMGRRLLRGGIPGGLTGSGMVGGPGIAL